MIQEIIASKFTKIVNDCCKRQSKEFKCTADEVQIRLYLNDAGVVKYDICQNYSVKKSDVSFKVEVLDSLLDMFGYEALCTPYFLNSFDKIEKELQVPKSKASFFIVSKDKKQKIAVFNGSTMVKVLNAEYFYEQT